MPPRWNLAKTLVVKVPEDQALRKEVDKTIPRWSAKKLPRRC